MALDFPGTPATGTTYTGPGGVIWVWDSQKWVSGTLTTGIYAPITNDVGRNLIHNSMFNIAQRGTGTFNVGGMSLDRWSYGFGAGDTHNVSQSVLNDTNRTDIGDEAATYSLGSAITGAANPGSYVYVFQKIEGVRRLAGKTVTVSFYANASVANFKVGVSIDQSFGTGGTPHADVNGAGQQVVLSSTVGRFARFSVTLALPSIAGFNIGTAGNDSTNLNLWYSSGSTNATRAGNIGVQPTGNVNIWGVQLEIGTVATPLEKLDPVTQLQQCQRFYCTGNIRLAAYNTAGAGSSYLLALPTPMRGLPVVTPNYTTQTNCSGTASNWDTQTIGVSANATATGAIALVGTFTASADL